MFTDATHGRCSNCVKLSLSQLSNLHLLSGASVCDVCFCVEKHLLLANSEISSQNCFQQQVGLVEGLALQSNLSGAHWAVEHQQITLTYDDICCLSMHTSMHTINITQCCAAKQLSVEHLGIRPQAHKDGAHVVQSPHLVPHPGYARAKHAKGVQVVDQQPNLEGRWLLACLLGCHPKVFQILLQEQPNHLEVLAIQVFLASLLSIRIKQPQVNK